VGEEIPVPVLQVLNIALKAEERIAQDAQGIVGMSKVAAYGVDDAEKQQRRWVSIDSAVGLSAGDAHPRDFREAREISCGWP